MTCSPSSGVEVLTGVTIEAVNLFSLLTAAFLVGYLSIWPHTSIPYVNRFMKIASIIHLINFGFGPQSDMINRNYGQPATNNGPQNGSN